MSESWRGCFLPECLRLHEIFQRRSLSGTYNIPSNTVSSRLPCAECCTADIVRESINHPSLPSGELPLRVFTRRFRGTCSPLAKTTHKERSCQRHLLRDCQSHTHLPWSASFEAQLRSFHVQGPFCLRSSNCSSWTEKEAAVCDRRQVEFRGSTKPLC